MDFHIIMTCTCIYIVHGTCTCCVVLVQSLDGIVQRDDKGLEKRFPVILNAEEKLIARKVSLAFKVNMFKYNVMHVYSDPLYNTYIHMLILYVFIFICMCMYMYMCTCKCTSM